MRMYSLNIEHQISLTEIGLILTIFKVKPVVRGQWDAKDHPEIIKLLQIIQGVGGEALPLLDPDDEGASEALKQRAKELEGLLETSNSEAMIIPRFLDFCKFLHQEVAVRSAPRW